MADEQVSRDDYALMSELTGKLSKICFQAIESINVKEEDKPLSALIIKYATEIDKGSLSTLARLGPMLLQSLEALQMSPRARSTRAKGLLGDGKPVNKLDELRDKRNARKNGTKDLHSPTA